MFYRHFSADKSYFIRDNTCLQNQVKEMKEYLNGTRGDNQKQIVEMETTEANAEAKLKE